MIVSICRTKRYRLGFTLVELMIVVAIVVLLMSLSIPAIRAMQRGSARAETHNTINAALQGARSYAIMNNVLTAARFQPNGRVVFVYRVDSGAGRALDWRNNAIPEYPGAGNPNADGFIYLPVVDQEPLRISKGYAVVDPRSESQERRPFFEPFYVCYRPNGSIAVNETICVALADSGYEPVNPDFDGDGNFAWTSLPGPGGVYEPGNPVQWANWITFSEGNTEDGSDRALARFYNVASNRVSDVQVVVNEDRGMTDPDYGPDHYGGAILNAQPVPGYNSPPTIDLTARSITALGIFATPDNWDSLPLFDANVSNTDTKQYYVDDYTDGVLQTDGGGNVIGGEQGRFETLYLNPYTGRAIRPLE